MKKISILSLIVIFIDQIVKIIVTNCLFINQEIKIIPNIFSLFYVQNNGAAFSSFQDKKILLIFASFIALGLIYYFLIRNQKLNKMRIICLSLLIGGIIANTIDRIVRGFVVDYLSFGSFPIFNIADICIVCGCALLIFSILREEKNETNC